METTLNPSVVQSVTRAIPLLLNFPAQQFWVDYDAGGKGDDNRGKKVPALYLCLSIPPVIDVQA